MMCDALSEISELLQSAHDTVEGGAYSPDSGVSSCSDSAPSSPILQTPRSSAGLNSMTSLTSEESEHITQLANAEFYTDTEQLTSEWLPTTASDTVFASNGQWCVQNPPHFLELDDKEWHHRYPALGTGTYVDGDWVETQAGFKMCRTTDGNARVKLGTNLTYDIDIHIDIPDNAPAIVKKEIITDETPGQYEHNNNSQYGYMDINNNHHHPFPSYQDDNCNGCLQRRNYYGIGHCAGMGHLDLHHPHPRAANPDERPTVRSRRQLTRTERLWEFILRLLGDAKHNPRLIEWVDREDGTFRLNNSKAIALMWGMRKNNGQMTYEKLSRALRYYYHRQILEPVLGKKLVYRFGPHATQVWENRIYRPQNPR
ncbi:uncharacterized protein [Littorina saxatilis]|uniref:ETS domain-containing protein n=1 Tax=Littorina saxatilis TaxID=31220 RepID=A0AAN9B556_9CAEN